MAQRYDTYKDSGVQWLGEIPGHWKAPAFIHRSIRIIERDTDGLLDEIMK